MVARLCGEYALVVCAGDETRRFGEEVVLIPAGLLNLLPLHAAWTEDTTTPSGRRYALDNWRIRYAPNARALKAVSVQSPLFVVSTLVLIVSAEALTTNRGLNAYLKRLPQEKF